MTVQKLQLYNRSMFNVQDETTAQGIDLANDTIKVALFLSTSNAATLTNENFGDLTNEVATAFGYVAGGVTLTSQTVTVDGNVVEFDSADVVFNASGGSITGRFYVLYSDTPTNKSLIGVALMDDTPADVTVTDGNALTLTPTAAIGWFFNAIDNAL